MLFLTPLAVVVVAASSVLAGAPDLPISPPTPSGDFPSPPVTPTTMVGASASPPIPIPPTLPIGMRRMYEHDYAYPPVPPTLPAPSPPVGLPEPVEELTNSERLARGLPIRAPVLRRPLEGCKSPELLFYPASEPKLTWVDVDCCSGQGRTTPRGYGSPSETQQHPKDPNEATEPVGAA